MTLNDFFSFLNADTIICLTYKDGMRIFNNYVSVKEIEEMTVYEILQSKNILCTEFILDKKNFIYVSIIYTPKTMKEKFLEIFPNARLRYNDVPFSICPVYLGWDTYSSNYCCGDCKKCWSRPYKEEEK